MQASLRFRILVAASLVALAAGCAMSPSGGPSGAAAAARLEAGGHYQEAARAWTKAAAGLHGAARADALFHAAGDYERAGQPAAAWRLIAAVPIDALAPAARLAGAETKARVALAVHRPREALAALAAAPPAPDRTSRMRLEALAGRAWFDAGEPARGLEVLVQRGRLAESPAEVLANDEIVWELLTNAQSLPSAAGLSQTAQGWIALASIERTAWEAPGDFAAQLADWRSAYPGHPAAQGLLAQIEAEEQARLRYPGKIAFLLPLSGPYAGQGRAVEIGLLAAYYRDAKPRPELRVYDTGGTGSGARTALAQAEADGAAFVIGPLTAAGTGGAASADPASLPVLALNYLQGAAPPARFYQFGLSPAQEARSSAERAVSQGLGRAVVLVPDNDWGQRIASAFTRDLTDLGGRVLASATFRPGTQDFAAPLSSLLGLDASDARDQRLAAVLGVQPGFSARRRQDVQFVFFAAPFDTARLIVPQIDYYQGLGLPVYSISDVYRPGASPSDLDGVRFPIMPWFAADDGPVAKVRQSLHRLYPDNWGDYARLYALGYDAWRLVPLLADPRHPLSRPVRGMTGVLALGPGNVILRTADWARYANGKVKAVTAAPPSP